tara:strand:- start:917 stop:1258 length:342 start_codon:yes stop_codon:yes gene_type:complete
MDYLDELSKKIEDGKREFEDTARRRANGISLGDVLKKLEGKTPLELDDSRKLRFETGPYTIYVSDKGIDLFGHEYLVNRRFEGEEVEELYYKLVDEYKENQKKLEEELADLPF